MKRDLDPNNAEIRARALLLDAALDLTRLKGKMRWACRLVLLQGRTPSEAARRVSDHRQNVYKALLKVRAKMLIVQEEADRMRRQKHLITGAP